MTAPGWYQSPTDPPGTHRWWDGRTWTGHVTAKRQVSGQEPKPAPIVLRILARIADWVIVGILAGSVNRLVAPFLLDDFEPEGWFSVDEVYGVDISPTLALLTIATAIAWEVFWLLSEGSTPGKQLLGLDVRDPLSARGTVEISKAIKRNAHRPLLIVPWGWVVVALSSVASLALMFEDRDRRQSLMDRFASTSVKVARHSGVTRLTPWLQVWLTALAVLRLAAWFVH